MIDSGTSSSWRWMRSAMGATSFRAKLRAEARALVAGALAGVGGQRLGGRRLGRGVGEPLGVHLVLVDRLATVGRPPPGGQRLVEHGAHGGDDEARLVAHAAHLPLPGRAGPACAASRDLVDAGAGSVVARPARGVFGTMEIRSVGVLGAGQMGLGIAQAAARAGVDTIMTKATPGALDAQRAKVEKQLQKDVERGKLTAADHGALLERLRWTTHLHDLAEVDLVIESIVEELPVKQDHFGRLDEIVKAEAIFATNTSTLTVTELAAATGRPERFIGLHFFNPVHAMKLIEVAPGLRTSAETVESCVAFARRLGKAPVVVADATGYIVNRLLVPYMVDAIGCLERGLGSIADIDAAMQNGANHPMGPLALADFIGLDIVHHMASLLQQEYREPRFAPPPLLRRMVLAGFLGREEAPLPPARERRARVAERVGGVGHHAVLRDRAEPHREAVGREPCPHPEEVERRVSGEREHAEQHAVGDDDSPERLQPGVEV